MILAGYTRHAFSRLGEVDIRSEPRWIQVIYPIGLSTLSIVIIIIGLWGWLGAHIVSKWWISSATIVSSVIFYYFIKSTYTSIIGIQSKFYPRDLKLFFNTFWTIYRLLRQLIKSLSSILEGDGGILWSIVLLVLFISLISQVTH
jgi:hypothetical protein